MNKDRRYLVLMCAALVTALCLLATFNYIIDAHRFFNGIIIPGINEYKTYATKIRLRKPVHIYQRAPTILLMGSSRAGEGLHCVDFTSDLDECYNSALRGITTYEQFRMLEHATAVAEASGKKIKHVVLKLSYATFTETDLTKEGFEEKLLAHEQTGVDFALRKAMLDKYLYALFSWEAFNDSRSTMQSQNQPSGWFSIGVWSLEPDGSWRTYPVARATNDPVWARSQSMNQWGSAANAMAKGFGQLKQQMDGGVSFEQNYFYLEKLLDLAYRHDIAMDIMLPTEHASYLQLLDAYGLWPSAEDYKRRIVRINESLANKYQKPAYRVWDFGGINEYTTEPTWADLPVGESMRWYVDIVHFSSALGAKMLAAVRDNQTQGNWYELIDSNNIETHLVRLRHDKDIYIQAELHKTLQHKGME